MWILAILLWRVMTRVLRRLGWGTLLVPVAAVGMLVFGVTVWTVAALALAAVLAVRRPGAAAGLLPAVLICAGIWGLALAAAAPVPGNWTAMSPYRMELFLPTSAGQVTYYGQAGTAPKAPSRGPVPGKATPAGQVAYGQAGPAPKAPPRGWVAIAGQAAVPGQAAAGRGAPQQPVHMRATPRKPGPPVSKAAGMKEAIASLHQSVSRAPVRAVMIRGIPNRAAFWHMATVRVLAGRAPPAGFARTWLLVPLALLMLTVGLWLMPRSLARLRQRAGPLVPYLRQRVRETGWGLALVPATLIGLSVFGAGPWTAAAVAAAAIVTIVWPKVAADLVPFVLVALALRGFQLAVHWQSLPAGAIGPGVPYGLVTVDGRQTALLAGAEASVFLAFGAWLVPRTVGRHVGSVFVPRADADLAGRVQRLTETRGHAVDAAAAELRRIERDLHDGAQARLVALGMNLRAVERVLPGSPSAALALVAEARETSVRALNELRDLIRGICPPVLADRGLGHAVQALVLDTPLPTTLDVDLPGRLTAPVESACYFAIAEALANAVKHAGARHAQIRIRYVPGLLRMEVSDDGVGGADPAGGTGLQGVERRLGTFDGIMAVSSPPGGPTMIVMEVPCALLSPKTCSC